MFQNVRKLWIGAVAAVPALLVASSSFAAITLPTTLDISDMETFAGVILAALAGMWIVRKLIKTTNKS